MRFLNFQLRLLGDRSVILNVKWIHYQTIEWNAFEIEKGYLKVNEKIEHASKHVRVVNNRLSDNI